MRVAVITQGISNLFESIVDSEHEIVGIIECAPAKTPNPFLKAIGGFLTFSYYLFTSNPLNLKTFSEKLRTPYYYFRKKILKVSRDG